MYNAVAADSGCSISFSETKKCACCSVFSAKQALSIALRLLTFTGKNYIIFLYAIFVYCGIFRSNAVLFFEGANELL